MTMSAVHASLTHLVAGQARNQATILDAIDAVVSAHQHGGKDAFNDRVADLRAAVGSAFLTMDAIHETARTAVGLPAKVQTVATVADAASPLAASVNEVSRTAANVKK